MIKKWPSQTPEITGLNLGLKNPALQVFVANNIKLFKRFSLFKKLTRVIADFMSFTNNCPQFNMRFTGPLTVNELKKAELAIIRMVQRETLPEEIKQLESTSAVHSSNKIHSVNPFLDNDQLMSVGGRFWNANINAEQKHPYVLASKHEVTHSILRKGHLWA